MGGRILRLSLVQNNLDILIRYSNKNEEWAVVYKDLDFWKEMCVHLCMLSCVQLFVIPWTVACQATWPMEFSRQELLEQIAISFAMRSSWPTGWICVSCIPCRGFFISWTTREAQRIEITKRISIGKVQIWSKDETAAL